MPHRRGRPQKSPLDIRNLSFRMRLTASEAYQLDLLAKEAGVSTAEFVRGRALSEAPAPTMSADLANEIYRLALDVRRNAPRDIVETRIRAVLERLRA